MTRSDLLGLIITAALAATVMGCPSGGVGDPCIPEDEYKEGFAGFKLEEENVESRSFQCKSRICLVNHFQGRVTCPQGQGQTTRCTSSADCTGLDENNDGTADGQTCTEAGVSLSLRLGEEGPEQVATSCDPACNCPAPAGHCPPCGAGAANGSNPACPATGPYTCACAGIAPDEPQNCAAPLCVAQVCSSPGLEWRCYVPGTDIPIFEEVCSQCGNRKADQDDQNQNVAVYCSCRCGPPLKECGSDGECDTDAGEVCDEMEINDRDLSLCVDPNFNYCECPNGYTCEEIRPNVGLGDKQIAGMYCVKQGTVYTPQTECGTVIGHWARHCSGTLAAIP